MKKETEKLYRISGMFDGQEMASPSSEIIKYYNKKLIPHYFFVFDRAKPIIACEDEIHDYVQQCTSEDTSDCKCTNNDCLYTFAWETIDELFTAAEAEKFSEYFSKEFNADLTIAEQPLPIDLVEACRMAFEYKNNGSYWNIYERESYKLRFKVKAYCYHENSLPAEVRLFTGSSSALYKLKENPDKLSSFEKQIFSDYRRKARERNNRQFKIGKTTDWQELCDQLPLNYKF
jgi:hypothetical protein